MSFVSPQKPSPHSSVRDAAQPQTPSVSAALLRDIDRAVDSAELDALVHCHGDKLTREHDEALRDRYAELRRRHRSFEDRRGGEREALWYPDVDRHHHRGERFGGRGERYESPGGGGDDYRRYHRDDRGFAESRSYHRDDRGFAESRSGPGDGCGASGGGGAPHRPRRDDADFGTPSGERYESFRGGSERRHYRDDDERGSPAPRSGDGRGDATSSRGELSRGAGGRGGGGGGDRDGGSIVARAGAKVVPFLSAQLLTVMLKGANSAAELQGLIKEHGDSLLLNALHDSAICHRSASLSLLKAASAAESASLREVCVASASRWISRPLRSVGRDSRGASNVLRSLAVISCDDFTTCRSVADAMVPLLPSMDARGVGECLWALSKMELADPLIVLPVVQEACRKASTMEGLGLANSILGLANLNVSDVEAILLLSAAALRLDPSTFSAPQVSMILRGLAIFERREKTGRLRLFKGVQTLAQLAVGLCGSPLSDAQSISTAMSSLAFLGDFTCIGPLAQEAARIVHTFTEQDIGSCLSALAAASFKDAAILSPLFKAAERLIPTMPPQGICICLDALSALPSNPHASPMPFVEAAARAAPTMVPRTLANTLSSIAHMHPPPEAAPFVRRLAEAAARCALLANGKDLARTTRALWLLGITDRSIVAPLEEAAKRAETQ